jgi:beta-glucosidase
MKSNPHPCSFVPALRALAFVCAGVIFAGGCSMPKSTAPRLPAIPSNTASQAAPRDAQWVKRHEGFVEGLRAAQNCQVIFIGDSITAGWRDKANGAFEIWERNFGRYNPVNLGIGGDRTQHVLWRLQNGGLGNLKPKAVVLMIGTNNTGFEGDGKTPRNTPAEAAGGVTAIVSYLRSNLPGTKILLLAIFPRGAMPDDPQRIQAGKINSIIKGLADGKSVVYLDIGRKFLADDGVLSRDVMPDLLHLSARGYQIWADAIREPLASLAGLGLEK